MTLSCNDTGCPINLSSECVFYEGVALPFTDINTNDDLQIIIQKLNEAIENGGGGSAVWGGITGTITDQTDLITYLSSYLTAGAAAGIYTPLGRNITINGVTQNLSVDRIWTIQAGHLIENSGTPLTQRTNLNFTNGLVASDSTPDTVVKLGGILPDATTNIDIDYNFTDEQILSFRIYGSGDTTSYSGLVLDTEFGGLTTKLIGQTSVTEYSIIQSGVNGIAQMGSVNGIQNMGFVFEASTLSATFLDTRTVTIGLQYAADYSADFTVRSLVDKGYVDGVVATLTGSTNEILKYSSASSAIGTKVFSTSDGNITFGDSGLVGSSRTLAVSGSDGIIGMNFFVKSTGDFFFSTSSGTPGILALLNIDLGDTVNNNVIFDAQPPALDNVGKGIVLRGSQALDTGHGGSISLIPGADSGIGIHGNVNIGNTTIPNYQAMGRGIFVAEADTVPTGNPTGGVFIYVEGGALKCRGTGGTITTMGPA